MTQFLDTPVDKSLSATGAWTDIDLSSDVPASATGAIFRVSNTGANREWGLRKNGSTDNRHGDISGSNQHYVVIGIDANRKCEGYIETTDVDFFLVGYTEADATFFTNAVNKSIGVTGAWTDINMTADIADGSVAAIFEIEHGGGIPKDWGLRKNGSTDNRHGDISGSTHQFFIVGVDATQRCEGYIEHADVDFFLVGYLTLGQAETNGIDRSLGTTGSYVDIDESADAPAGATGIFGEVNETGTRNFGVRKNGTSFDYYLDVHHHDAILAGVDANDKWEGKIENTSVDFFTLGYFVAGVTAKTSSDVGVGVDTEAELISSRVDSDAGAGVDAQSDLLATIVGSEVGAGVDAILESSLSRLEAETGVGVDALVSLLKVIAKFSSDTGVGADAILNVLAALLQSDSGSGADVLTEHLAAVEESDVGEGLEEGKIGLKGTDAGAGADAIKALSGILESADTGAGADAIKALSGILESADTGAGADAASAVLAALSQSDTGVGTGAVSKLLAALSESDSGSGIESELTTAWLYLVLKLLQKKGLGIALSQKRKGLNIELSQDGEI